MSTLQPQPSLSSGRLTPLELKTRSITPPLSEIEPTSAFDKRQLDDEDMSDQPTPYGYLLNLFTAPDMQSYLAHANVTEDVYALPIHLQRLISEAKEEVVIARTKKHQGISNDAQPDLQATKRLELLRNDIWARSGHDVSNMMAAVTELIRDDDELQNVMEEE